MLSISGKDKQKQKGKKNRENKLFKIMDSQNKVLKPKFSSFKTSILFEKVKFTIIF